MNIVHEIALSIKFRNFLLPIALAILSAGAILLSTLKVLNNEILFIGGFSLIFAVWLIMAMPKSLTISSQIVLVKYVFGNEREYKIDETLNLSDSRVFLGKGKHVLIIRNTYCRNYQDVKMRFANIRSSHHDPVVGS